MADFAMNQIVFRSAIAAALLALAGCGGAAPTDNAAANGGAGEAPLAGATIGGPFTLTNQDGERISDTQFAGKYRVMYFGYTYCPDICPVDAQRIGAAVRLLEKTDPAVAEKIVPIFVTVDPERDGPAEVKAFVSNFHPRMVGLTGTPEEIAAVAKQFAIYYAAQPPSEGGGYLVDHQQLSYLMGPQGEPIALLPVEQSPEAIAAEIKRWVT